MAGEYEKAITIKDAIDAINQRDYLLPAIQRKFVWSSHQICVLFDSIMRGYPINTFMMWEIKDDSIKNDYKFYEFLKSYCQRFSEENPHVPTNASYKDFRAVIDGQQRLTSLYIGLCGTYAYKKPRVWWPSTRDDKVLPPRKLYLDLKAPLESEDDESLMYYNFKFLTDQQYQQSLASADHKHHWFCMHDLLKFSHVDGAHHVWSQVVKPYVTQHGLEDNEYSLDTLGQLYDAFRSQRVIHYFKENSQEIDHVLDVFIRTNSGGTKLDFSDLLMSIAVAHWDGDFRKELDDLTQHIHQNTEMGFYIERDWLLKTCLMLTEADVRFKVRNFKGEQVARIQQEWPDIKECITETFRLVRRFGITPQSLTSRNAVIPICYYLYKKCSAGEPLFRKINNLAKCHEQRAVISQWFYMALLKGVFGGQADSILSSMRDVLVKHLTDDTFPLPAIIKRYKATNKDLRFDEETLDKLLETQHGEGRCRALLHLLFPEMNVSEVFHIDHLHPRAAFDKKLLNKASFLQDDEHLMAFYRNPVHWNAIPNLHLLNHSQNLAKKDRPLKEWLSDQNVHLTPSDLLIENVDLEFISFKAFYLARREALKQRLISRVYMSAPLAAESVADSEDEELEEVVS
ncbi:hypothetical protein HMEPL2_23590 [Vreelandella aquamarina]|jgi:uncharacterized protein with ParB-like and HNH nuclease domain|uniref:GmrSD restriction endonucleases N-terminal domain-containing protein n=1 Tax=Vreelandella aquamarina TaxID=77097 RepID=A0A6F8XD20_9GAMM|nr:DUF262 domain-containing protein [Halomonas meridiana]BCB72008.1 hypothetical protein HMEPL2_23590 [Halomonas meridiana]|tara:strand:- start:575 stop:2455 length:1881 start_codon:yes stop_codon:yes gene_type:complete